MMNLMRNRVFITVLATDIIQQLAIWVRNISIMFFVMEMTNGDPLAISTLNFIEYIPMLLLTFLGGLIADKYNPKKIMMLGDFLSFISFIILGLLIGKGILISIYIVILVSAIVTQFSYPASQKYFKEFIPEDQVEGAIGISQLLGSIFFVVGPFLGSFFYFNFGMQKTLSIISILFIISLMLIWTLPNKKFVKLETTGFFNEISLTINYMKYSKELKSLLKVFVLLSFTLGIANNLDIFVVTKRLGLDEQFYQFFSGTAGIGVIAGGLLYLVFNKYLSNSKVLFIFIFILSITIFIEGYSIYPVLTLIVQLLDNAMLGILSAYIMAKLTKITNQEYLGKVNGLYDTIFYLGISIGTIFSGYAMKMVSIVFAYGIGSLSLILLIILLYLEKRETQK